jgi:hypothetical protein
MNPHVIASPDGDIVWVSGPLPGAVHDLTAAGSGTSSPPWPPPGLVKLGDKGYHGEGDIRTPCRGQNKPASQRDANQTHARPRSPGERTNASSSPDGSCVSIAAAPDSPDSLPRPSTFFKPAKPTTRSLLRGNGRQARIRDFARVSADDGVGTARRARLLAWER